MIPSYKTNETFLKNIFCVSQNKGHGKVLNIMEAMKYLSELYPKTLEKIPDTSVNKICFVNWHLVWNQYEHITSSKSTVRDSIRIFFDVAEGAFFTVFF